MARLWSTCKFLLWWWFQLDGSFGTNGSRGFAGCFCSAQLFPTCSITHKCSSSSAAETCLCSQCQPRFKWVNPNKPVPVSNSWGVDKHVSQSVRGGCISEELLSDFCSSFLGVQADMQMLVERRIYPFLLMVLLMLALLSFQIRQFKRLYQHIKNDKSVTHMPQY